MTGKIELPCAPLEGEALQALSLAEMTAFARALPADGAENPASPLRKPALATISADGAPAVRTVILRSVDAGRRAFGIFTDARSSKVAEIARDSRASLLFYDPRCDIQVRFSGRAAARVGEESAWASAAPPSRRAYLVTAPPGTPSPGPVSGLPPDAEGVIPPLERLEEGRSNFALVEFIFDEADIVVLSRAGNRRARIRYEAERARAEWLVP
ncbi:MAG: pyridoxamine 5'-phosphate oxidase family protein [Parvibaculum sp.]|uniref:pyridoxamine 5'-phosphate oxidase family protein n=1 Tax=Parvibaculum sp. TaxID=2024848 RepID=UPI003263259D